jgi:hypothetical protein
MHSGRLPDETFRFSGLLGIICMINPDMFQLASALLIGLLGLQWVRFLLARGIVLSSRRERREPNAKQSPLHRGRKQQPRCQHAKQEREAERWRHGQREWATQSEENDWWRVLEVSPYASADHIRRSYLRKIKESHPDRVAWLAPLAPGFLQSAERRAKMLNVAYADATRARRGSNGRKGTGA